MKSSRAAIALRGLKPAMFALLLTLSGAVLATDPPGPSQYPNYPSETPAQFTPVTSSYDYVERDVMIPMRDGVKLNTVILIPKGITHAGIVLTRTPYDAKELTHHMMSGHLGPMLEGYDNATDVIVEDHYIRVIQDIRGKYGSEGDYVMNRPIHGPLNPTPVDDASDTYDTIDWLVKNVPESNGKVGTIGISYDGFEPLMSIIHPHPALKVAVPMNPMVDGWMGDDWFHHGAFRQQNMSYIYEQSACRDNCYKWWTSYHDEYDLFMQAGSAGELGRQYGMEQLGFWNKMIAHPAYDSFWSEQAVDKVLAAQPLKVPTMLVHSLWDQEDIYGALAVYRAIKPKDTSGEMVKLVMGPWHHGQEIEEGSSLGAIQFGSDTAKYFREHILRPYLAQYLKDGAPKADIAPVTAFQTGTNQWQRLSRWPLACEDGCKAKSRPLYLQAGNKLGFSAPANGASYDEYISDPARPVPFRARPIQPIGYDNGLTWPQWLVDDQREASGRTDVVTYVSDVLTQPLTIAGAPVVHLTASTSGTDSDWVVKLIDVYPDQVAEQPEMGGYQLAVAMDIFRGRYREGYDNPKPLTANQPLAYRFELPNANHVFLPGHRVMVQVQSSWFPLYDRNPQTFVSNIFWAKPGDYQKATQRIYHSADQASYISLPVIGD
ncbi:CocE/NonD family hydrolase [Dyella caseinilytica]|uniref:CocE/NonD family hydrolase n=1 Tax=Dyella caseinilytica TaxID=1849581 RepID=A0ABX7GX98_9GAMM|nr:CocE/NonD family hydrolase [Dyella caseinilytica]QRN54459.1 CocE/NonD family hydrolase [Dyella caseinilytica]GFZ94382.1 glutaryl-7-ACA acylase [Dyella caseinilytica]